MLFSINYLKYRQRLIYFLLFAYSDWKYNILLIGGVALNFIRPRIVHVWIVELLVIQENIIIERSAVNRWIHNLDSKILTIRFMNVYGIAGTVLIWIRLHTYLSKWFVLFRHQINHLHQLYQNSCWSEDYMCVCHLLRDFLFF